MSEKEEENKSHYNQLIIIIFLKKLTALFTMVSSYDYIARRAYQLMCKNFLQPHEELSELVQTIERTHNGNLGTVDVRIKRDETPQHTPILDLEIQANYIGPKERFGEWIKTYSQVLSNILLKDSRLVAELKENQTLSKSDEKVVTLPVGDTSINLRIIL